MYNITPAYNQFQFDRAQQINELLVSIPQCRAVSPDRSLLEAPVRLANGATIALRINVPQTFPQEKPVLSVTSPVRHPWVDSIGRLSFPTLERWAVGSAPRLAAVVTEAIQGLGSAAGGSQATAGPSRLPSQQHPQPPQPEGHAPPHAGPPQKPRLPPPRSSFPELEEMSNADLAAALTSEASYRQLLQQIAGGDAAAASGGASAAGAGAGAGAAAGGALEGGTAEVVRRLRTSVEAMARRNLEKEQEMAEVRNQIAIIRSSEYAPARAAYDEKAARQQRVLELLSPKVLVSKLQAAAAAADEDSDRLYKQYTEGGLGLEAFVSQYTAARAVFHQRDLKAQAAVHTIPMDV